MDMCRSCRAEGRLRSCSTLPTVCFKERACLYLYLFICVCVCLCVDFHPFTLFVRQTSGVYLWRCRLAPRVKPSLFLGLACTSAVPLRRMRKLVHALLPAASRIHSPRRHLAQPSAPALRGTAPRPEHELSSPLSTRRPGLVASSPRQKGRASSRHSLPLMPATRPIPRLV